jgi:hypothetical protein
MHPLPSLKGGRGLPKGGRVKGQGLPKGGWVKGHGLDVSVEHKGGWVKSQDRLLGLFAFLLGFHSFPLLLPLVLVLDSFLFGLFRHSHSKVDGISIHIDRELLLKGFEAFGPLFPLDALAGMLVGCGFFMGPALWFLHTSLLAGRHCGRCSVGLVLICHG